MHLGGFEGVALTNDHVRDRYSSNVQLNCFPAKFINITCPWWPCIHLFIVF